MLRRPALVTALLVLSACADATAPLPREGAPDVLEFSGSGFGVGGASLELRGDTVVLIRVGWSEGAGARPAVDTVRSVPGPAAWRAFWHAADEAGVRRWEQRYMAENVADGYGWSLRLEADGARIESGGSNAYPDRAGREHEVEATPSFLAFHAAVEALAGAPLQRR